MLLFGSANNEIMEMKRFFVKLSEFCLNNTGIISMPIYALEIEL